MSSNVELVTSELEPAADPNSNKQGLGTWFRWASGRRAAFWTIVVVLGFLQAWSNRLLVDHDAVAYLDIAENYARGAWSSAVNAYYSPLYSWLIALMLLMKLPRSWESTLLHLVNFTGYLGAYACFEFFLGQLIRKQRGAVHSEGQETGLSESVWQTLGLGLFLYSSVLMANLSGHSGQGDPGSTPDIFVLVFVFLAAGLLLRMQSACAGAWTYGGFGAALGFGYLAKTAMFPLAFIFMAVAGFISIRQRKSAAFLLTPVFFVFVAGPWIAAMHKATGEYTYGDAGKLTYRWLAGPQANPVAWGGETQEEEHLIHPPRRLLANPPIFEFARPVGTFPLWYGSSYWLEGWKFHFSWSGQKRILHEGYNNYRSILQDQKEYVALLLLLLMMRGRVLEYFKSFLQQWVLWVPATAALGMYILVRVEPRYVAAFLLMLWITLFAAVKLPTSDLIQQFIRLAVVATVLATGLQFLHRGLADFHTILRKAPSEQSQVAEGLHKLGIFEGQTLATIGIPQDSYYWARLAGVRVVSEIPTPNVNQYWFASSDTQQRVHSLFAQTGAVAIVTDAMPAEVSLPESTLPLSLPGWERIGSTSYFLFHLKTETPVSDVTAESKASHDE